jgi:hypothetical protein
MDIRPIQRGADLNTAGRQRASIAVAIGLLVGLGAAILADRLVRLPTSQRAVMLVGAPSLGALLSLGLAQRCSPPELLVREPSRSALRGARAAAQAGNGGVIAPAAERRSTAAPAPKHDLELLFEDGSSVTTVRGLMRHCGWLGGVGEGRGPHRVWLPADMDLAAARAEIDFAGTLVVPEGVAPVVVLLAGGVQTPDLRRRLEMGLSQRVESRLDQIQSDAYELNSTFLKRHVLAYRNAHGLVSEALSEHVAALPPTPPVDLSPFGRIRGDHSEATRDAMVAILCPRGLPDGGFTDRQWRLFMNWCYLGQAPDAVEQDSQIWLPVVRSLAGGPFFVELCDQLQNDSWRLLSTGDDAVLRPILELDSSAMLDTWPGFESPRAILRDLTRRQIGMLCRTRISGLRHLELHNCDLTAENIGPILRTNPDVTHLVMTGAGAIPHKQVTEALMPLRFLRRLETDGACAGSQLACATPELSHLTLLEDNRCNSSEAVAWGVQHWTMLERLNVSRLNQEGIGMLATRCLGLRELRVRTPLSADCDLTPLLALPRLRSLAVQVGQDKAEAFNQAYCERHGCGRGPIQ